MYTTANGPSVNEFHAYSSPDLLNWTDEGVVFNLNSVSWATSDGWAPCVVQRNGNFYFYYTANKKIGVAVGSSPTGPFTDIGAPWQPVMVLTPLIRWYLLIRTGRPICTGVILL
ncbi:family 43 glycosylhydrolase [Niabella sp. W65]|nr:family 43 glycosylhydrolase [Niabella sp. W65]MCH7366664.1 family 43 glycosylhydrolase [Niabella sp. W65]